MRDVNIRALVLLGDGINCERETALALTHSGADARVIHINDLLAEPKLMRNYDLLAIPGGFSFGDELGSGKLLSLKIKKGLMSEFEYFVKERKPIIGICNGFQVLVKLGLLRESKSGERLSLMANESGSFINSWADLIVEENTKCKWINAKKLSGLSLPIRHGEGNLTARQGMNPDVLKSLEESGNIVLRYKEDVNGSLGQIAGICSDDGLIFGLMPHPEANYFKATSKRQHINDSPFEKDSGAHFFDTIIDYLKRELDHV